MKTRLSTLIMVIILFSVSLHAQIENKLKFHSISVGAGYFGNVLSREDYSSVSFINEPSKKASFSLNVDLALQLNDYIFSIYFSSGLVNPIPYKQNTYSEYNLTVGKEFLVVHRFTFEGHFGIGLFEEKEQFEMTDRVENFKTVGFPLRVKSMFDLNEHFAFGLNPNININFSAPIFTINIIGQLKF